MKILSVVATRPNFIKECAMQLELKNFQNFEWKIVHTGQHYDYKMSSVFFEELKIPKPDYFLNIGSGSLTYQRGKTMIKIEKVINQFDPDIVITYGDVNATLGASIAAKGSNKTLIHLESGVRGNVRTNPEEINRIVSDVVADYNICFYEENRTNLLKEGFDENSLFLSGDLHYDVFNYVRNMFKMIPRDDKYILVTIHRNENKRNYKNMKNIIDALSEIEENIIWPVHPGTEKELKRLGLWKELNSRSHIQLLPPLGYLEFSNLIKNSSFIFTDSGGVRREAYFWEKPCLVLVDIVWFNSIQNTGWIQTVGANKEIILKSYREYKKPKKHPNLFGDGHAANKILNFIQRNCS